MTKEEFMAAISELNISYEPTMLTKLAIYYQELVKYNENVNLTAITEEGEVYLKHFYDSLTITKVIDLNKVNNLLDIGSGAGFPGVVLKIFFPHLKLTLIDSNNKKTTFLKYITEKLELSDVQIINDRVENYAKNNLNKYDLVVARAVTNLNVLVELSLPLVKKDGFLVAMKGRASEELKQSEYAITTLGAEIIQKEIFNLNHTENMRTLIKMQKKRETLISELRSYDKIIKKPLQKK